ncbi:MAG: hypothetical protein RLZZ70_210 [Candidatus Parcubacteria bacterium]
MYHNVARHTRRQKSKFVRKIQVTGGRTATPPTPGMSDRNPTRRKAVPCCIGRYHARDDTACVLTMCQVRLAGTRHPRALGTTHHSSNNSPHPLHTLIQLRQRTHQANESVIILFSRYFIERFQLFVSVHTNRFTNIRNRRSGRI